MVKSNLIKRSKANKSSFVSKSFEDRGREPAALPWFKARSRIEKALKDILSTFFDRGLLFFMFSELCKFLDCFEFLRELF